MTYSGAQLSHGLPEDPFEGRDLLAEHRPFLDQIDLCECPLCRAIEDAKVAALGPALARGDYTGQLGFLHRDEGYHAAIEARLAALRAGTHQHVTIAERARRLRGEE